VAVRKYEEVYLKAYYDGREARISLSNYSPLKVRFIVLEKEADWEQYTFLYDQKDLWLVMDSPKIAVFQNLFQGETQSILMQVETRYELPSGLAERVASSVRDYQKDMTCWIWNGISLVTFIFMLCVLIFTRRRSNMELTCLPNLPEVGSFGKTGL